MYYRHTGGRWRYFRNVEGNYTVYPEKCDKHPKFSKIVIAEIYTENVRDGEANARLTATAPEMCEALEDCAELLEQLQSWENDELDAEFPEIGDLRIKIGRILSKAGGYTK